MERVQFTLQLLNLRTVLVLNSEVVHLDLNVADLSTETVLLLLVADNCVEHSLQILDLIVYLLYQLVLCLLEDGIFDLHIDGLDLLD